MKRSYFCPESFLPAPNDVKWAIDTFKIDKDEVMRQVELMKDHEFRRAYSSWPRVFRNWMRKAEEINTLKRPRTYFSTQVELTDEQREEDRKKWEEDMRRLRVVK